MLGYLVVAVVLLAVLGRLAWRVKMWAWRTGLKDPRERLEAEIMWSQYRRSRRR